MGKEVWNQQYRAGNKFSRNGTPGNDKVSSRNQILATRLSDSQHRVDVRIRVWLASC